MISSPSRGFDELVRPAKMRSSAYYLYKFIMKLTRACLAAIFLQSFGKVIPLASVSASFFERSQDEIMYGCSCGLRFFYRYRSGHCECLKIKKNYFFFLGTRFS